jgi:protein transport protein SEC24
MVVSDLDDMYCPLINGYLVNPAQSRYVSVKSMRSLAHFRSNIEKLLNMLPDMMENQPDGNRVAAGSALKGALAGLVRLDLVERS